jgi:hypothetical protein
VDPAEQNPPCGSPPQHDPCSERFGELLKFTLAGFAGGLIAAALLDRLSFQQSALGQWFVRTLAGEGESLAEGLYALRRRLAQGTASTAEAYGWGKLLGVVFPWIVDLISRLAGVAVDAPAGFYIPYFYAMSDQIGGNLGGLVHFRRREGAWKPALARYLRHPVMLTGLGLLLLVPIGLLGARLAGFRPSTQMFTALETIAANLCWLPPLVGWWCERRGR